MRYISSWLTKQLARSYERSRLQSSDDPIKQTEKFVDENRRRIQDLELVTKEIAQKLEKVGHSLLEAKGDGL